MISDALAYEKACWPLSNQLSLIDSAAYQENHEKCKGNFDWEGVIVGFRIEDTDIKYHRVLFQLY